VKRRRHRHRVDEGVCKRDALRSSREREHPRHAPLELCAHLRERLDGDHVRTAREEQPRELAGAGSEVEHGSPGAQVQPLDDALDRRGRIVGPAALVHVGDGEAARGGMQFRHDSTDRDR
jgi:hypothetical protein